jgi:uncharacterized membrane protein YesL
MNSLMGGFYRLSEWVMRLAYVNLLWILFTLMGLMIFGFIPASVAMMTILRKWVMGEEELPVFATFWQTYRKEWLKSNMLGLFFVIVGYILYLDLTIALQWNHLIARMVQVGLLSIIIAFVITVLFIIPVYVHFQLKWVQYIKFALMIGITHPFRIINMVGGAIILYYLFSFLPSLLPFFGVSLFGYLVMWSTYHSFKKLEVKQDTETKSESEET